MYGVLQKAPVPKKLTKSEKRCSIKSKHIDTSYIILPYLIIQILNSHSIPFLNWSIGNWFYGFTAFSFSRLSNHGHHRK
ncbi:hypothetical protein GQ55_9G388000 [Panicum hallii var. hallii]|uniref:Uncharacterized protein n=1 Tax=Panicum hallii var. hallii TaxID=1504633 RepID=A0A2T7C9H3_9POAL|nr:hypothetical protein GQ55_9G388000 [Panicum hallii var. hallii]